MLTSIVNIGNTDINQGLKVNVNLSHPNTADLSLSLISPNGIEVLLIDQQCPASATIDAVFSDEGTALTCTSGTISGNIIPQESLALLNGDELNGTWQLKITNSGNSEGVLNSWGIEACSYVLGVEDSPSKKDIVLYPNPNDGNFTLSFDSTSTNPVNLAVSDMAGRLIINKELRNTGNNVHNVALEHAQAGLYLVTIRDGDLTTTKKIIVK